MHLADANEVKGAEKHDYDSLFDSYLFPVGKSWQWTAEQLPSFVPQQNTSYALTLQKDGKSITSAFALMQQQF